MPVLTVEEMLDALPDLRVACDRDEVTREEIVGALRTVGAEIIDPNNVTQTVPLGREILVPFTRVHISLTSAKFALFEITWHAYKIASAVIGGGAVEPGDMLSLVGVALEVYNASTILNSENGEYCTYLAVGRSKSEDKLSDSSYPTAADIAHTLSKTGTDWCGMQCRFHAIGHVPFGPEDVRTVLLTLRGKGSGVVEPRDQDGWWVRL